MKWSQIRRMAISLPLAMLAAIAMVAINEVGYQRSNQALEAMAHTQSTRNAINHLMQNMLDAETGLRGYLLTSDERYLEPYNKAITSINGDMDQLRELFIDEPDDLTIFSPLSRQVSRKTAEMELSLRLFREGNEEAWRFVMFTDMGKQNMDAIRSYTRQLTERSDARAEAKRSDVENALWLSRLGIATVTVIGLLAFYMYLRQTHTLEDVHKREQKIQSEERSRLEDLVRERTATLTELANHLQQVREDERGHLARELHDELGSLLTAAKLDVARLKSRIDMTVPEVADRIMHLTETLNSGIALKRRIIEDLRPSSLSNLGLTTSLEILTREFAQRSNIEVESSLEQVELPDATQLTVYRIVQESLTNIGKYASASRVVVSVHNYPTYVAVQIQDNGNGFDMHSVRPNSHGLAGMRHRVEAAGGRLTVTSALGDGTTISAVIPTAQSSIAA
ncbi:MULTISPECIES: CHASE3 domain-containing protein [Comamonas]|uniref:histidine kinase n=1 Tax=Comamonas terrigena TaxID=32013 RepID=A0A2A7UTD2_COMTR|nr:MULTISPECIES: CHASE3 domain-containing protein [Comamonas]MBD9532348.1 CHASE3 domain-containing protein [Comamonas sp. CMM01]MBV7418390.1 CHASE3 domain-containing protein [Comamonas sp. CMM03]MDH0048241.1 CHASE3 domain-containing protein [Comamonas terrigena]MDH0510649.1 CHASE3 domain-containing protein [Comamonas terrigena]MDH1090444.1 CHASE3 domain-containing protein [Comamonas terrigena]